MSRIPGHVLAQLGVTASHRARDLRALIEACGVNFVGLLASPEAREDFTKIVWRNQRVRSSYELPAGSFDGDYAQATITHNGTELARITRFGRLKTNSMPPSAVEDAILNHWLSNQDMELSDWIARCAGNALVECPQAVGTSQTLIHLAEHFVGLIAQTAVTASASPLLRARSIEIRDSNIFARDGAVSLFSEALGETNPKWRFLSLYRTLEHGYLHSILEGLSQNFLQEPKAVLESALKAISREVAQLNALVEENGLELAFEEFQRAFKSLVEKGSQFCTALERHAKPLHGNANLGWQKGIQHVYSIRCSIAHAGTSGLYVERYPDWRAAFERLLDPLEAIVLQYFRLALT